MCAIVSSPKEKQLFQSMLTSMNGCWYHISVFTIVGSFDTMDHVKLIQSAPDYFEDEYPIYQKR